MSAYRVGSSSGGRTDRPSLLKPFRSSSRPTEPLPPRIRMYLGKHEAELLKVQGR
jgi:hypothetical protein